MDRRAFVLMAAALAACERQEAKAPEEPPAAPAPDPAEVVRAVYAPYFVENGPIPHLREQAPWSADMGARIDAMIARAQAAEEPVVDFDPIINAQDYQLTALAVTTDGVVENSHAVVRAHFSNMGHEEEILYDMVWEGGAWKVDNLRQANWDLRQVLAGSFAQ